MERPEAFEPPSDNPILLTGFVFILDLPVLGAVDIAFFFPEALLVAFFITASCSAGAAGGGGGGGGAG